LTFGVLEQNAPSLVPSLFSDIDIAHDFDATGEHRYQIGWKILIPIPSGALRTIQLVVSAMHILLAFQGRCH
jgi:hypothetical protein